MKGIDGFTIGVTATYVEMVFFGLFPEKAVKRDGVVADENVARSILRIQKTCFCQFISIIEKSILNSSGCGFMHPDMKDNFIDHFAFSLKPYYV
jgi:hypothetical protein